MKKLNKLLPILLVLFMASPVVHAFQSQELPVNSDVKIGKLDNGFTYYIHANPKPENRVEFRLAVNAGSILEDKDQLGLAHFTEHMLFNGTENFKKNELIDFLQKMGLEFGGDLNAYTSFDETVYILPTPLEDPENLDKALKVLSDWSHKASMDDDEVNKERGVVLEEWRLGRGASQRMREATWPIIFKGSLYAERLPIGTEKSLENFKTKAIKRFYKDWYRPDLMALVAVGDFDADEMEAKIKKYFSDWKMAKNPRERVYTEFPDFKETRVAIATDAEASGNSISVSFMTPGIQEPKSDVESFRKTLLNGLFSQMINQRMQEKTQVADPPFLFSFSGYGSSLPRNKNEYTIYVSVKDGKFAKGLKAAVVENERVRRHGFTQGELERVKAAYLNSYDRQAKEADKRLSARIVNAYVGHFLRKSAIMSPQQSLDLASSLLPTIKVEEINELIKGWMGDEGQYITVNAMEENKGDIPSEAAIKAILKDVRTDASIEAYKEEAIATTLLASTPKKGKVVSEETNATTGITKMELSNGATIYAKATDFKNDEIRMTSFSEGGHSLYGDEDFFSASYSAQLVSTSGLGDMSAIDLRKFMTGKTASVRPYVGAYEEGMSGFSSLKDLEVFFQLVYKNFTDVRKDEKAFESWRSITKNQLANIMSNPEISFQIEQAKILTDNHPRGVGFPSTEDLDNLSLDRSLEIYKERFADASDFTFVFVGNIDMATFKPMIETYIGSLPTLNSKEKANDLKIRPPKGQVSKNIYAGVDKKSNVTISLSGDYEYDLQDNANMSAAASILTNKMIETLREEMGGVYGAGARASISKEPWESFNFSISFPCDPDNVDALVAAAMAELEKVKAGDFTEEDLSKVVTARVNNFEEQIKSNGYWERTIGTYLKSDLDLEDILKANERNKAISKDAIVAVMKKYLTKENMIKIVKLPEEYKKGELGQEIKKN